EDTPLSALALAVLAEQAGIPAGIFNLVTTSEAKVVGETLTGHQDVRKISFTGSTQVGKILMKQSADTVKKVSLELGGNAPFIVFESADLDKAVEGAIACKFRNAGQTCVCANRIYVQDSVYEEFADKLADKIKAMKVGDGTQDGVVIGPLINEAAVKKVEEHVSDAKAKGGKVVLGGEAHEAGQLFYTPTLITDMSDDMKVACEETFGPVAGLFKFFSEEEVITKANDTPYGLASYFYSNDLGQCFRVSEALEYGMVGVNEPVVSGEAVPFGGVKESGIGREGSKYGIDDFTEMKYILLGGV
ncbi:MAG: aldehyde dehydrogenase family protein, partial [Pseudomonadota bacterium]|nr:aldehyde dehydrogenase family protein [Pseudomonadota bacterium]